MRVTQRLNLIDRIGRELQARYRYDEIDSFLAAYDITHPSGAPSANSKWVYSKEALAKATDKKLRDIANELDIDVMQGELRGIALPEIWQENKQFRLFISHLAIHKDKAFRMKETLSAYHICGFVAHEDINPTREWQNEIERALCAMDAMITINTRGFSQSVWTQQEVGFALGRGIKILSLRLDEDPQGFISKHQAILRRGRTADQIAEEVNTILLNDALTRDRMAEARSHFQQLEDDEIPF